MILKIVKGIWFVSLMAWMASFLYVYASLQEMVIIREAEERVMVSREVVFYAFLGAVVLFNGMVFIVNKLFIGREEFLTWFYGLIVCLNVFFLIVINFIAVINSGERFSYDSIGYFIYGSVFLFTAWACAWPLYSVFRRISSKPSI